MSYRGDIRLGDTIDVKFTTRRFSTGAPFALASGVISAYVGNSTTQITAGITLTADFDGVTGLNNVRVVATSGNGFATATNVDLVITTGTVDSVSVVGEVIGSFSIENRSALMPTTAARTLVVDAAGLADANMVKAGPTGSGTAQTAGDIIGDTNDIQARIPAALGANGNIKADVRDLLGTAWLTPGTAGTPDVNVKLWNALTTVALPLVPTTAGRTLDVSAGGEAGLDWANVGSPTTSLVLSGTTVGVVTLVNTLTTYTGNTVQTGDSFARLGAPAGASVSADIAAIEAQTDDIGVAGLGLSAIPWNAAWDAEVQSEVDDALKAALTEGYRGTNSTGSVRDMLYEIIGHLGESSITNTTKTVKKIDGSTTAKTYTLDSSTLPTSITETT